MTRPSKHVWRLLKWGRTLARHGALRGIENDPNTPLQVKRLARIARFGTRQPPVPDYAAAFQDIGPAAIKLGQSLATRPDLVGEEAARNLLTLQDSLPPVPFTAIEAEIARSFEVPVSAVFADIDPVPVGSASIAQVHRALTSEGREVAVKVLRPGIRERLAQDIATYEWAAAHLEALGGEARRLRPALTIANFKRWTNSELDLRREAASASELAEAMRGFEGYCIPSIDWDRTNGRVMTIEWIDGIKISDVDALRAAGHDLPQLASRLVLAFLTQAISAGFFHADMHQGNLFVDPDGHIVAVDFGIVGRLGKKERRFLAEILYGFITRDYRRVASVHFEAGYVPAHHDVASFAQAIRAIGEPIHGQPAETISMAKLLTLLFEVTELFEMETRPELVMLQKTMVVVEGVARTLNPQFNMWKAAEPVVGSWIRDNLGPKRLLVDLRDGAHAALRLAEAAPEIAAKAEKLSLDLTAMAEKGMRFDEATAEAIGRSEARHSRSGRIALWIIAIAAVYIAWQVG